MLAPATLTGAFMSLDQAFVRAHPGVTVLLNRGHSPDQVLQLEQGAPADLFASAGRMAMRMARSHKVVDGPATVSLSNVLQIVVPAGNPRHITGLASLAKPVLTVVLPAPQFPVGQAAVTALHKPGSRCTPSPSTRAARQSFRRCRGTKPMHRVQQRRYRGWGQGRR
ncbi:MAG: substrate-binding domain-containing protein [Acidimicrobiales bacterium]